MNYLSAEQVLFIHARIVSETGGSHRVRDLGLLQSAVARPAATFEANELYPDVFTKAAALMDSLINDHPFLDGNKRTGMTCAAIYLRRNGWRLVASHFALEEIVLLVATEGVALDKLAGWLRSHSDLLEV